MTINLAELQELIQAVVQKKTEPKLLFHHIQKKPPLETSDRIKIYQDAYEIRLHETIKDDFCRVKSCLLSEFDNAVSDYVESTPSSFSNLAEYSEGFVKYIKENFHRAYEFAIYDWLEILSERAEPSINVLAVDEVNSGVPFKMTRHSSANCYDDGTRAFLSYLNPLNEVCFLKLDNLQHRLFNYFVVARSGQEVEDFIEQEKNLDAFLFKIISDWIAEKILVVCRGE